MVRITQTLTIVKITTINPSDTVFLGGGGGEQLMIALLRNHYTYYFSFFLLIQSFIHFKVTVWVI